MENLLGLTGNKTAIYTVYSFSHPVSDKKGSSWRNHGECTSREEAFWISHQLQKCEDFARIEVRLQKFDEKTNHYTERAVKVIDKRDRQTNRFIRFLKFFPAN
ncbi:MAG: hypothetical protein CL565_05270 [Alphaproteobacteria bacterium]|nr:hypothetical protein [Alphaproteobacteria bacterium]|tara:strand:- start:559 stop:867 length:309 start_codon:yes stop_codon:yes gene_type:complete